MTPIIPIKPFTFELTNKNTELRGKSFKRAEQEVDAVQLLSIAWNYGNANPDLVSSHAENFNVVNYFARLQSSDGEQVVTTGQADTGEDISDGQVKVHCVVHPTEDNHQYAYNGFNYYVQGDGDVVLDIADQTVDELETENRVVFNIYDIKEELSNGMTEFQLSDKVITRTTDLIIKDYD